MDVAAPKPNRTGRRSSFSRVLEVEALVLLVVCFLGALLYDFKNAEKRERAHAILCSENELRGASGEFAAYLFSAQGAAGYSATIMKSAIEHGEDDENLSATVVGLMRTLQATERVKYKNVFVGRSHWIVNSLGWKAPADFDPAQRIWYKMAMACPGRSVITPPYVSAEDGHIEMTVARALGDAADTVLGIDIEMSELKLFVKDIHVPGARCGMLIAPNGYVLGCQATSTADVLGDGPRRRRIVERVLAEQGSFIIDDGGVETLVLSTPVNSGWRAVLLVDMSVLNGSVRGAYLRTLVVIGVILLTALFFGSLAFYLLHRERVDALKERQSRETSEKELSAAMKIQEARAAERAKSAFLATMSHEIRTPLNAVIGFTEFLKNPRLTEAERSDYLAGITKSSNALLSLINDVLDLSKIEAGKIDMRGGTCDMVSLFEEMSSIFTLQAQAKGIKFGVEIDRDFPVIGLQEERMRQILINLIGNAMKFTAAGSVTVRARFDDPAVTLEVVDTGIGIHRSKLQEIFDPFAQDGSVRGGKVYEGTGLGLAICKRLVASVDGTIEVDSDIGMGSRFTVHLPDVEVVDLRSQRQEVSTQFEMVVSTGQAWQHVVLVDDVHLNLVIASKYVELAGVPKSCIVSFHSAIEALEHLRKWRKEHPATPTIVITDLWMPEMTGEQFVGQIRAEEQLRTLPVVAVTADAEPSASFNMSLFNKILTKPMTGDKVRSVLDEITH